MPDLHVQQRDVPTPFDILRRVQVGVLHMPAGGTTKLLLVLARSAVHCAAARAGLGGVSGIDLLKIERLVGQHRFDLMPTDIQDGAVQSALLGDAVQPRPLGHVLCPQALDNDGSVIAGDFGRGAVRPVLADTGLLSPDLCRALNGLTVAVAAALASGRDTLQAFVLGVQAVNARRQRVAGAVTQHQRHGNATINTNRPAHVLNVAIDQATDTDLPAKRGACNGRLPDAALNRASVAELDPTNLGQTDARPFGIQLFNGDLAPNKAEAVASASLLELGKASLTLEESLKGGLQILHRSLLGGLTNGADKVELSAQVFQLPRLCDKVQIVARRALVLPPMIDPLIKAQVPHKTAHTGKFQHRLMLFTRGFQSVCEAAKNHINLCRSLTWDMQ